VRSLLPEGRALAWAIQHFGIPEDDRYGLIEALGADVAGAVRVLTETHSADEEESYEKLSAGELADIVDRSHEEGLALNRKRGVKLSLAGMQDKVLLHRRNGDYYLPLHGAPSSLIVKPEPRAPVDEVDLGGLATNELFCLGLAHLCGLNAARATVEVFGSVPSLVVERYDRESQDGNVLRRHQEDLLGAMGRDPLLKYERAEVEKLDPTGGFAMGPTFSRRPGPSLADMANCLVQHVGRARLLPFVDAVVFNLVIGNADSHARNYSVLLSPDGNVEMAPLYDLVSTVCFDGLDQDYAQRVNGVYELNKIVMSDLIVEVASWGIPEKVAKARVYNVVDKMRAQLDRARDYALAAGGSSAVIATTSGVIERRIENLLRS
jgi:serine/threonine-protein kinase HipA